MLEASASWSRVTTSASNNSPQFAGRRNTVVEDADLPERIIKIHSICSRHHAQCFDSNLRGYVLLPYEFMGIGGCLH